MSKAITWAQAFYANLRKDQKGAALVEYTVLLGVICTLVIVTIIAVGGHVNTIWTTLQAQMAAAVAAI